MYDQQIVNRTVPNMGNINYTPKPTQVVNDRVIYSQKTTKNKSFLDMHHFLKSIGIKNNEFMLALIDPDLDGINPHDPLLSTYYKQKVFRECLCNYWYFLREVVRVPSQGGDAMYYKLNRANLALNFCFVLNFNIYLEISRQLGKTVSSAIRYLYVYNFGTTNSKMAFLHKNMDGAKDNLQTLKDIRDLLPAYLVLKERVMPDGKVDKGRDSVTLLTNPFNNNTIKTYASATNKAKAASLLRGKTLTIIWYDEYGFIPYNDTIYMNAAPAYKTASMNAKKNGSSYGILITSTPGFLSTNEGKEAYNTKEEATRFDESWYDLTYNELMEIINANTKSDFVYIKFSYQELGCTEEWFNDLCKLLKNSWTDIRREILLEWATGVENSPFKEEDLEAISNLLKQPIDVQYLLGKYRFETYLKADTITYPPIIGVDVSGGYKHDSSTITVVDSFSTKVLGCLNCNYISTIDLAKCIAFITKNWMPNAVINVERNGGFGSTVISKLLKMGLKKNLYYEIKDVIAEERQDGVHAYKTKIKTKVYGLTSTKAVRQVLIDLLIERSENHKDKFISPIIYNEMCGMEIKRNGKVEHSASTHDDQVFSMLMALYVWYEGTNLYERYGIRKSSIRTDDDIDEILEDFVGDDTVEIVDSFNQKTDLEEQIDQGLNAILASSTAIPLNEFLDKQREEEKLRERQVLNTPLGQKAYREKYHIPDNVPVDNLVNQNSTGEMVNNIPDSTFFNFYSDSGINSIDTNFMDNIGAVPESQVGLIESEEYRYRDYFNF